jgi:hypothetical protein
MAPAPPRRGRRGFVAVLVGVVVTAGALVGTVVLEGDDGGDGGVDEATTSLDDVVPMVERPARPEGDGAPTFAVPVPRPAPPERVLIPSIGVDSGLEELGLGGDGRLAPPQDFAQAGWFAAGTQPGQRGPAVIAGHVDSPSGAAVFARLDELTVGDEVLVDRVDGSRVAFRVTAIEQHPKDRFPTERVYGPVPGSELRVVTCDGVFDRSIGHYRDNLVVYAVLAGTPALG